MKRKDFFKTILGVTAAAVVAPAILVKEEKSDAGKMLAGARAIDENFDKEWSAGESLMSTTTSTATT